MARSTKYGEVTVEIEPGNPLNGTDEPVFVIRSQDSLGPAALSMYAALAAERGLIDVSSSVAEEYLAMTAWQRDHPDLVKDPD